MDINENHEFVQPFKTIPGLGEALFQGNTQRLRELLSGLSAGEIIRTWGLELLVDKPTQEETELMKKSLEKRQEF